MSEKASSLIRDRIGCIDGWYRTEVGEMRSQLMDAADAVEAIESENAMLRMQLADVTESMGRVEWRCAKLRELAAGIGHLLFPLDVDYCVACPRDDINHPCPVYTVERGECLYKTDLRELGIEVDDG